MRRAPSWVILALSALAPACEQAQDPVVARVAVEAVDPGGAASRAGLRAGDRVVAYRFEPAGRGGPVRHQEVLSCTDLAWLEQSLAARGRVSLEIDRAGHRRTFTLPAGEWGLELRPRSPLTPGAAGWEALVAGRRAVAEKRWQDAQESFGQAQAEAARTPDPRLLTLARREQGLAWSAEQRLSEASGELAAALAAAAAAPDRELVEAQLWHDLGKVGQRRGDLDASDAAFARAAALRTALAPGSLALARTVNNQGINAWLRGQLAEAEVAFQRALKLVRQRGTGSLDEADVLNNLGLLARDQGRLSAATRYFEAAFATIQRSDPGSERQARVLSNLGLMAAARGETAAGERFLYQSLELWRSLGPDGPEVATVLFNLGVAARDRWDLAEAERLTRDALALQERLAPGSLDLAASRSNLAFILLAAGRVREAEPLARQALDLRLQKAPFSHPAAVSLGMMGAIRLEAGDLRRAAQLCERALAIEQRLAPGSGFEAAALVQLGHVALAAGDLPRARRLAHAGLWIRQRVMPDSAAEAEAWSLVARVETRAGALEPAVEAYRHSIDLFEGQPDRLGLSPQLYPELGRGFESDYQEWLALELSRGERRAAWRILERSRARGLRQQLASRPLRFRADLPPALLARRREVDRHYERLQGELAELAPQNDASRLEVLLQELGQLRAERAAVAEQVAREAPRFAALHYAEPIELPALRAALPPGSLWLSYFVGERETRLFVVRPLAEVAAEEVEIHRLPVGREALRNEVDLFRGLILRGRGRDRLEPALRNQGQRLFRLLLSPLARELGSRQQLFVSPDAPLYGLPFGALVFPGHDGRFLLEELPTQVVPSASVFAQLRAQQPASRLSGRVIAFANPTYPPRLAAVGSPARRAALPARAVGQGNDLLRTPLVLYREGLPALPGAEAEVLAIARLFGPRATTFLGNAATESAVKSLRGRLAILHFACHALLDSASPLDSALALATPASSEAPDNGLLQAWEIFDQVQIEADLVTLSACETGLGREAAGEGLIGLSRAFQYAGARSVLASLWAISDRSTAELMQGFYGRLAAGEAVSQALRAAQLDLLHGEDDFSQPYFWAAFELVGAAP